MSIFYRDAYAFWKDIPNIVILGNKEAVRLPIFSIVFYHKESGMMLHHNFVCAVLNDVFGIQARGGCACAGPYAEVGFLLGDSFCIFLS